MPNNGNLNEEYTLPINIFTKEDLTHFTHQVDGDEITVSHNCLYLTPEQFYKAYTDYLEFPSEVDGAIIYYLDTWHDGGDECMISGGTDEMGEFIMVAAESGRCAKLYPYMDEFDEIQITEIVGRYSVVTTLVQLDIDVAYGDSEVEFRSLDGNIVPIYQSVEQYLEERGFVVENEYDLVTYTSLEEIAVFLREAESLLGYDYIILKNVVNHG